MASIAGKRVGISGGGIGGTAFALALEQACKVRGISPLPIIKIYERDASPSDRGNLGYSFSLVHDEGLQVVHQLQRGIVEDLYQLQEPGADTHICFQTFQPLIEGAAKRDETGRTTEILRIMRTRLRQVLLAKVPPDYVQYGKICVSAIPAADTGQPVQLAFADGSREECDLLVVADGANSKLRAALLPDEKISYAGVCMLFGRTGPLEKLPRELQKGHYLVLGKSSISLFMGSVDKNTVTWSLTSKMPESQVIKLTTLLKDPTAAQEYIKREVPKLAEGFSEPLFSMIRKTNASSLTALPAVYKLPHAMQDNGIAYIGDAWHAMSPFAGAGANMALQDAWELAQQLVNGGHGSSQEAISQFAAKGAQRSVDAINASRRNIALAHSAGWKKMLFVSVLRTVGNVMRVVSTVRSTSSLFFNRGSQSAKETA